MQERVFKQNEVIFWEGSVGTCLYKILEGNVAVILGYGTKEEKKLTELEEGRIFGEMAVLESWPRSATVVAVHDKVRVLEISEEDLSEFFDSDPAQIRLIMENLSRRLLELTKDYTEVCDTIQEMRLTRGEKEKRKEGLLSRISKFLSVYTYFRGIRTTLEAMERYEDIEEIREKHGQPRENLRFKKGQIIFREGDSGDSMYYIGFGTVGIYTEYGTEHERLLTELHENTFFGELGLIEKQPRSATAVIRENGTVLNRITEESLDQMYKENPSFILLAMQHISSRLRKLTKDYVKACRTLSHMNDDEKGQTPMTEEDKAMVQYYMEMAKENYPFWY